jgi:Ca2+-transporting ATPase
MVALPQLPAALSGLTPAEAEARLRACGPNRLVTEERWAWLKELLGILGDPMALMLAAAASVYLLLGETTDGIILLLALIPVLGVDVFLEARSREALKKLARLVAPRARVIRAGQEMEIPTEALVPGDILVVREGDILHADGVVRWCANLALDESPLTGESEPQEKRPFTGTVNRDVSVKSRFFAGSLVLAGHGYGEITATGARTEYGHIARLVAEAETEPTPLQRKTGRMVRQFAGVALLVAMGVFALGLWRGATLPAVLLAAISLAMAAIPEEFPLVFTLFLSLGAWRLSRCGVLVRRLVSIETLGSTTVICADKTGTLTAGQLALDIHLSLSSGVSDEGLLEAAVLACEPHPTDTLERVIVAHCREHGIGPEVLYAQWRLVYDHPFDPVGKHMSHVWQRTSLDDHGAWRIVAKGALEGIVEHCDLTPEQRAAAESANARLAGQGMRVLAVAGKATSSFAGIRTEDERDLRLYGLLGFRDPLRPEVPAAIAECQAAGIAVKLITGDHALTAHAIADAAGIAHAHDGILTGEQLDGLPEEQLAERASRASIFARIRPEQKYAIVDALKGAGEIVTMTGDGINDAPALRRADIGVSMGSRATAVARAAADLVLLDDNFAALVATVREGRQIFGNIQRAFLYLLAFHVPILGLALAAPLLGLPLMLLPVHLVWLELIVHPVSALLFEGEPAPPDLMRRPPRDPRAPLLPSRLAMPSALSGLLLTAAVLGIYWARLEAGPVYARSAAMSALILGSLLLVWAERAGDRPWSSLLWPKTARFWIVWGLVALSLPLSLAVPTIARVLQVGPISVRDWALAAGLAVASIGWRAFGMGWRWRT